MPPLLRPSFAVVAVAAFFVVVVGASCTPPPPPRPLMVPSTAAWSGPAEAPAAPGVWIDCWRVSDEHKAGWNVAAADVAAGGPAEEQFDCSVFDERGAIQKKARFRLLERPAPMVFRAPKDGPLAFRGFDGCRVLLDGERVLLPLPAACDAAGRCDDHCP